MQGGMASGRRGRSQKRGTELRSTARTCGRSRRSRISVSPAGALAAVAVVDGAGVALDCSFGGSIHFSSATHKGRRGSEQH